MSLLVSLAASSYRLCSADLSITVAPLSASLAHSAAQPARVSTPKSIPNKACTVAPSSGGLRN